MYSWLKIEPLKGVLQPNPLLGYCPPINLEALQKTISHTLQLHLHSITPKWQYSTLEQAKSRIPVDNHRFSYALASFEGITELYFSRAELSQLAQKILGVDCPLSSSSKEAILDFFVSGLVMSFTSQPTLRNIQPTPVAKTQQIKSKKVLEGSIRIECEEGCFQIHVLVEDSIYQQWLENWARAPYLGIPKDNAEKLQLPLHVKLSQIEMPAYEVRKLKVGDWISLKEVGIEGAVEGCKLELTLCGKKLGEAHLKNGQVLVASRDEFFDRLKSN